MVRVEYQVFRAVGRFEREGSRNMIKSKSYFPKILRDFLITLIVPILALVLLYFQAEGIVKEQILLSNQNTLNQFFELIDTTLSEMEKTGYRITVNKVCQEYASYAAKGDSHMTYKVQEVINVLDELINEGEKYEDLFIYYPGNGRVISGINGCLSVEDYASIFYGGENNSASFWDILECEKKSATLYVMESKKDTPLLCVVMRKDFARNPAKDYVVVQVIEPNYLNRIMTRQYQTEEGVLLIFDKNKQLLLSGDGQDMYHLEGYTESDEPYKAQIEEQTYMMQARKAGSVEGYYAFATPAQYFWKTLSNMRLLCILSGLACALASIVIAYRGSKRTYSPLGNIVSRIEEHNILHYDSDQTSEVEFIENILEKTVSEKRFLNRKSENAKQERFVVSLLQGHVEGLASGENDFKKHGIELCSDKFMAVIISVNQSIDMDSDLQGFIIKNVFEELCNRKHKGYVVRTADSQYAALVNVREGAEAEEEFELWREGQNFLKDYFKMTVTAALGEIHEGMKEIQVSYKEAKTALHYKYLLGEGECICYRQVKEREFSYLTSVESKLSRMVIGYIKEPKPAKVPEIFVRELLEIYGIHEQASMDTVECFKYEVLSVINKAILSHNGVLDNRKELLKELMLQPSLEDFRQKLTEILTVLWEREQQSTEQEDICKRARTYILEHFKDYHLSVTMLGDEMKVSPSYLSKLFKDKYEISIPDFISQSRINSSKADLRNTNKSIKQIAEENGFLSSTVFINTFKKWEGVTPGIYRNLE